MESILLLVVSVFITIACFSRRVVVEDEIEILLSQETTDSSDRHRRDVSGHVGPERLKSNGAGVKHGATIWYRCFGCGLFVATRYYISETTYIELTLSAALGLLAGELAWRRSSAVARHRESRRMEFFLPIVMERVVMAVSAGMDVLPALNEVSREKRDPISLLLSHVIQLTEQGIAVVDALKMVVQRVDCLSVRHAFVHLALAYKEGGELVRPLRELSDATQSFYQESIEEEIARLPVKAVMPLVVTFTGLIVCFLTVPLVQVSSLTGKVTKVAAE